MNAQETLEWQRDNKDSINRLAKQGDKLALRLIQAYQYAYDHQADPQALEDWMKVCDDYVRRELTNVTRRLLQDRFGHKIPKDFRRIDS